MFYSYVKLPEGLLFYLLGSPWISVSKYAHIYNIIYIYTSHVQYANFLYHHEGNSHGAFKDITTVQRSRDSHEVGNKVSSQSTMITSDLPTGGMGCSSDGMMGSGSAVTKLVGGFSPTPLNNDGVKVSWDDEIPNIWNTKTFF